MITKRNIEFLVIAGPTASGKSQLALELAREIGGDIVCCDSVQLYRGFNIGSAKPTSEEQQMVPHHLFDSFNWNEVSDAALYARMARQVLTDIKQKGRIPIVVGGTGLYLRALMGHQWDDQIPHDLKLRSTLDARTSEDLFAELQGIDPQRASQLHQNDRFRVIRALEINMLTGSPVRPSQQSTESNELRPVVLFRLPRDVLYQRINLRTNVMLENGLIEEVQSLLSQGVSPDCKPMGSIGYKEVVQFLDERLSREGLEAAIATATRQYAKRQMNWFRKVPVDLVIDDSNYSSGFISQVKDLL